ncbi:MAG: type II toxin-antitoxin system Phd/YefM family antitoxin [Gemmatimonadaceae bacterium]
MAKSRSATRAQALPRSGVRPTHAALSVTSTEAQNEFARVLEHATGDGAVIITRHNKPKAVVVSYERYQTLTGAADTVLDTLTDQFDALLARMQTPDSKAGLDRALAATPAQMGRAAVAAARAKHDL